MKIIQIIVFVFLTMLFFSCGRKELYENKSRGTGWHMNGTKEGVINSTNNVKWSLAPGLVLVEGGTFTMGKVEDDVMGDGNARPTQQHVMTFCMDETEVTNLMYLEYIEWIKKIFPPNEKNYSEIYKGTLPDTLVWSSRLGYADALVKNYLRHPAYGNYPVVGVNWIQAVEFCRWRTDRVNEASLERYGFLKKDAKTDEASADRLFSTETYLKAPTMTYGGDSTIVLKGAGGIRKMPKKIVNGKVVDEVVGKREINVYALRASGVIYPEYRLPTEVEWEYAAEANAGQREYNNYRGKRKYPWSGGETRYKNGKGKGSQLANFKQGHGDYGGIAGWSDDAADITNEVKSYSPNDLGLYDMAGNVAEWVADVYRPIIDTETNDFNYYRGNVYTKNKIGKDGKIELVTKETIKYDTLSNGTIMARSFPGEIVQIPVDENETFLRMNFDKSYELNFRDGDVYPKRGVLTSGKGIHDSRGMYNSPDDKITIDSLQNRNRIKDKSNSRTTLISDKTRVYKGGSWKDRAYWLSPSQRRYLSQEKSTDFIGFRCAMSRVGAKANKEKSRRN